MRPQRHILVLACLHALIASAQDPQLSQFYAAPLYLNPALTGNTFEDRLIANYRTQWNGLPRGYDTYAISYDHRASAANSGFGAFVMHDEAGTHNLAFTHAAAAYAYQAAIDHRRAFRVGLRVGVTTREYDPGGLLFADQVIRDNAPTSLEPHLIERVSYLDASFGGLYFSEQFWTGFSFSHINRPEQSLLATGRTRLPVRTSIHTGYRFPIDGRPVRKSESFMTLAAHYKMQQDWDQLDIGGYIEHQRLMAGVWYRGIPALKAYKAGYPNDDAVILMVGYETEGQLQIAYSYDVTISWLTLKSGGAHEISLQYEWPKRAKNRRFRAVPCPKF